MGVSQIFQFRRLFRKRRVVEGNRHFVVGHDRTKPNAKSSSTQFPKGSHFIVGSNHLSPQEQDICNNNEDMDPARSVSAPTRYNDANYVASEATVVFTTVIPEVQTHATQQQIRNDGIAVLPTTELKESTLFGEQ